MFVNRVCCYDVNIMKCVFYVNEIILLVYFIFIMKLVNKNEVVIYVMKEGIMNSKLWLFVFIGFFVLVMCSLVGFLYIYWMKNVIVVKFLWKFCVIKCKFLSYF